METKTEFAVFGGGCFWCMEAVFEHVPGVKAVVSGYAGGHADKSDVRGGLHRARPATRRWCASSSIRRWSATGICSTYSGTRTTRPAQPAGRRRRHAVPFDHSLRDEAQKAAAEKSKAAAQARYADRIVTEIVPLKEFCPAEEYHQHYFAKNPTAGYCRLVIRPKVSKLQKEGVISK